MRPERHVFTEATDLARLRDLVESARSRLPIPPAVDLSLAAAIGALAPSWIGTAHGHTPVEEEVCALVVVAADGTPAIAAVTNTASRRDQGFRLDEREVARVLSACAAEQREIVAVLHTHPNGDADPSAADDVTAVDLGGLAGAIVALDRRSVRAVVIYRSAPPGIVVTARWASHTVR